MAGPEALLLCPVMPAEGGNGLAMRAGVLLEGLARVARVRVLTVPVFGPPAPASDLLARLGAEVSALEVDPAPDPVADMRERLATPAGRERTSALHPLPRLCRLATVRAAEAVAGAADGASLVLAMRLYLAPLLDTLLDRAERPAVILDVDDVESVTHAGLGDPAEAARFAALERWYAPRVDALFACSPDDAALLEACGARSCTVVPNAVRWPSPAPATEPRHDLLFVGNLSYAPNVAGVRWLCEQVLPLLPGVRVAIVGSRPAAEVLALADGERVTVAGDVPDVSPWYAGAAVAVVPLQAGGGTRIKILEAFAHRRPVVATPAGACGLSLEDVLIGDGPAAFAQACRRLLEDRALAERLARSGAAAVRASASVDVVLGGIESLLRVMLER